MDETNRFDKQCGRNSRPAESDVTRRTFLGATAAGAGTLLVGGLISPFDALASAAADSGDAVWIEKTIPQLQALMNSGELTSLELTRGYLKRIKDLNPLLHAVIETNPQAEAIAARLDAERRKTGGIRGPLHGIPILVKDNIATDDTMQTTAGSLALVNSRVPADATIVSRLRRAGAVILGKANLSDGPTSAVFHHWTSTDGARAAARRGIHIC